MLRRQFALPAIVLALSILATTDAVAAGQRSFVASSGLDTNPCTLQLPCRTFAPAIAATNAAGEVIVLDSAGYGSFTITKAISIIAPPGVYAGFSPTAGQTGVTVAAGASDKVVLRGLTINGQGGDYGIVVSSGGQVHIEQCTVSNMGVVGIQINGGTRIQIRSSIVRSNGVDGLQLFSGTPSVDVVDSQFDSNGSHGILVYAGTLSAERIAIRENLGSGVLFGYAAAGDTATVTVADSIVSKNGQFGVEVVTIDAASNVRLAIERSTIAKNGNAGVGMLTVGGAGTIFASVSDSAVVENAQAGLDTNGVGVTAIVTRSTLVGNTSADLSQVNSAVLRSSGNNTLTGRGAPDISGTLTANPLQ